MSDRNLVAHPSRWLNTVSGQRRIRVAFAAGAMLATAGQALGSGSVVLYGIARDFLDTHPDFGVPAAAVQAANVAGATLDADGKPVFSNDAWRISDQWRDIDTNPIPYDFAAFKLPDGILSLVSPPQVLDSKAVIDVWDSGAGPYDASTAGTPQILTGQPMPTVSLPTMSLASAGEMLWSGHGQSTLSTSYRCDKFLVRTHHQLRISGDVTVVVNEEFKVENQAAILLDPGATLTLYLLKDATVQDQAGLNANTQDPSRLTIYHMSNLDFMVQDQSQTYANIISPQGGGMMVQNGSDVFGSYTGDRLTVKNTGGLHLTGSAPWPCGFDDDHIGAEGDATSNAVASAQSFRQWFSNVPGVNASAIVGLPMDWNAGGYFEFATPDFRPIDGELLGSDDLENRYFTFQGVAAFAPRDCSGGYIEIECDGEAWVYIGDRRVLDIGAPGVGKRQRINVDRLELPDGVVQEIRFFYAQRTGGASPLVIRTNLDLFSMKPEEPVSALWD